MQVLVKCAWLLAILVFPVVLSAQVTWIPLQQSYDGIPYRFLETEQSIISGWPVTGIVASSDDGRSWEWDAGSIIPVIPLTVNARGDLYGLWRYQNILARSTDNGTTWEQVGTSLDGPITEMVVAPSGDLFALILHDLKRSSDGGVTWTSVSPLPNRMGVIAVAPNGTIFASSDGYTFAVGNGAWRSTDNGASWNSVGSWKSGRFKSFAFGREGEIFVSTTNGIRRSNDNGRTFDSIAGIQYRDHYGHTFQYDSAGAIWFISGGGFYKMSTDGRHVDTIPIPAPYGSCAQVHLTKEGSILLGFQRDGIWRSDDSGRTWKRAGLDNAANVGRLVECDSEKYLASITHGGLYRSVDREWPWQRMNEFDRELSLLITNGAGTIFAASPGGILYRSTNCGYLWNESYTTAEEFMDGHLAPKGAVVLASAKGIHYSADSGNSWTMAVEGTAFTDFAIAANGDIWAASIGSLYRSVDDGRTWTEVGFGGYRPERVSMAVTPDGIPLAAVIHDNDDHLLRSTDNGVTWHRIELPCPTAPNSSLSIGFGGIPYMTTQCGLYRSMDDGVTWELYANLPRGQLINALLFTKGGDVVCRDKRRHLYDIGYPFRVAGGGNNGGCHHRVERIHETCR